MDRLSRLRFLLLLAAPSCVASVHADRAAAPAAARVEAPRAAHRTYDAKTFYETTSVSGASFSPDESKILVSSDAGGVFNAWVYPVDGGAPTKVTDSTTNAVFAVSYFPKDERILVTSDKGGNELNHLFVREADGRLVDLTPGEKLKSEFAGWSADDGSFFVTTNERDARFFDLYRYAVEGYARERIFENPGGFFVEGVSLDGRWIALSKVRNNLDNDLFVVDAEARAAEPKKVTPHEGDVFHGVADFTPDGKHLVYLSNEGGEFARAWTHELATGGKALLEEADWDISFVGFSRDGRFRVTSVNADARSKVTVRDVETGAQVALPQIPGGDTVGVTISRSGKRVAFYVNGDTSPSNLFVVERTGGEPRRLTSTLNPAVREEDLVASEVVRYRSFDGLEIPAILYRPKGASKSNRAPAIVWVHGGPGGQSRCGWRAEIQYLLNHGYAILAVNNRGSSGYGKSFFHMDDRKHGDVDLQDCIFGRRYLEGLDWVDGNRVAIMGGSYGGYMVAAALAFTPDAFDCGIDIFGVTNWVRTLESMPAWWEAQRQALYAEMGDPATDKERLRRISPLFHADRIRRPLLVVQGANDPRVLQVESDEIVAAARKNAVPVDYVVFPDEGHGFRSKANRIKAAEAYRAFLDRHLGARSAPSPAAGTR